VFHFTQRLFLHYLGKSELTKYCILPKVALLLNVNNAPEHILFTFLQFGWHFIQFFRFSADCNKIDQNVGQLHNHRHEDNFSICWCTSIKFCCRLIQTSLVASWIHKHSLTSCGKHTAARQSNLVIDWLLGATDQERRNLSTFFSSFQRVFCLICFPQVVQKQTLGEVRT